MPTCLTLNAAHVHLHRLFTGGTLFCPAATDHQLRSGSQAVALQPWLTCDLQPLTIKLLQNLRNPSKECVRRDHCDHKMQHTAVPGTPQLTPVTVAHLFLVRIMACWVGLVPSEYHGITGSRRRCGVEHKVGRHDGERVGGQHEEGVDQAVTRARHGRGAHQPAWVEGRLCTRVA